MTDDVLDLDGGEISGGDSHAAPTTGLESPRVASEPARGGAGEPDPDYSEAAHTPAHNLPPAEEHVIACCFLDEGQTLDRATADGITVQHFSHPALRAVWATLTKLRKSNSPLDLPTLAEAMGGKKAPWPLLIQITGNTDIPTTAHYGHYAAQLKKDHLRHTLSQVTSLIADRIQDDPEGVAERIAERLAQVTAKPSTTVSDLATLQSRRITLASSPVEPTTRLFLAGKPVATPGNLTTLISKAKTGKTATIGSVVAAIVGAHYDRPNLDTFGFTAPHTKEAVVLLDTEQSPFDAFTCHKRAFARAGQTEDVDWLHHYSLVGYTADRLRKLLPVILAEAKSKHGAVFTLILDGVADFVASVNDEQECNTFVAELHGLAVTYDCPILCVIHSNEAIKSGDDGRGHLGKQLTRKAESNLLLKKVGDVTTITSEKQRKAPITDADGIAFQWDDTLQRHASCNTIPANPGSKAGPKPKYDPQAMLACVPAPGEKPMPTAQIHRRVAELPSSINIRTFKDYLAKWVETGEVERIEDRALGFVFRRQY